jgi:hypothetical protein
MKQLQGLPPAMEVGAWLGRTSGRSAQLSPSSLAIGTPLRQTVQRHGDRRDADVLTAIR